MFNTPVSEQVVRDLQEKFPGSLPRRPISGWEAGRLSGQQDVIDYLKNQLNKQTKETTGCA